MTMWSGRSRVAAEIREIRSVIRLEVVRDRDRFHCRDLREVEDRLGVVGQAGLERLSLGHLAYSGE
jgi:hypothetical protein